MAQENSISQELADLLVTNNFDPEYRDEGGQSSGPADANTISFDYRSASGNNYGSAVAVIGDDNELMLFFGDNLGRSMQDQDKDEWFAFLNQMRKLAQTHRYTFSPQNLSRLKHSLAGQAAVKEGLFEGYYGSRRESFIGEPTEARILIKHNKIIGEDDKRYRYIESIFIETADGERFKLQSNRLIHGRAMLEHVRQGGRPYDVRGNHINEMVQELSVLSRFNRAKQHHVYEGITQELVESAAHYYRSLQENLKRLSSSRGYHTYFESWAPDQIDQQESLVEDLKNMFVQQTLDTRIEAALPTLAKIQQQGTKMKEAEIFENYMNRLSEGTWALPDTPEAYEKLQQLMTGELIVGADAMNATEQLYDLVGDDELFDILNDLADNDPRANIWDDSDVQRRLAELGVQTPQSTQAAPAAAPQDTAPPAVPAVAEGQLDEIGDTEAGQAKLNSYVNTAVDDAVRRSNTTGYQQGARTAADMLGAPSVGDNNKFEKDPKIDKRQRGIGKAITRMGGGGGGGGGYGGVRPGQSPSFDNPIQNEVTDDFGPGPSSNDYQAGPTAVSPDSKNYKTPDSDRYNEYSKDPDTENFRKEKVNSIAGPISRGGLASIGAYSADARGQNKYVDRTTPGVINKIKDKLGLDMPDPAYGPKPDERERLAKRYPAPTKESAELARMLKHAGVPLQEGVLTDSTGSTLEHIKDRFGPEVREFTQSGDMDNDLYDALYDYYFDDMPYGTKKARDGDPHEWVADRFADDLGINENLISPMIMPVSEGSCNMTMEGQYCPEHGLMECGSMYEDDSIPRIEIRGFGPDFEDLPAGKKLINPMQPRRHNELSPLKAGDSTPLSKVANVDLTMDEDGGAVGMPYSMGEGVDDPINYNAAMTGSYYEGKETEIQEGDALLARIKSLALLR
jgi:hypothetical protein